MMKENFEKTIWYRLLKVIYIGAYVFVMAVSVGVLWSTYDVYVSDYEVRNSSRYIEENRDGVVGRLQERLIKEEIIKEERQDALKNIALFTPVIIFLVWFFFLVVKRLFFYVGFGEKFLRLPKKLFD